MRITGIEHIAIVVPDIQSALTFWRDALGLEVVGSATEEGQSVDVAFMPVGDAAIELVEPSDPDSGVARFLEHNGPGIHHVCLEVDDLDAAIERMRAQGVRLTSEEPYVNASGRRLIFIHPRSANGVLVELYEAQSDDEPTDAVIDQGK